MKQRSMRQIWKKGLAAGLSAAMAVTLLPAIPATAEELSEAASTMPFIPKAGSISVSEEHATYDEPFRQGTAGCKNFRIPALITLQDGKLLATAVALIPSRQFRKTAAEHGSTAFRSFSRTARDTREEMRRRLSILAL